MTTYNSPKLFGHEVLHAQRRFIVFKIDQAHPFQGYEAHYSILVFDKLYDAVVGFCDDHYSGYCSLGTFQQSIPIKANNAIELIDAVRAGIKAYRSLK